ncbi:SRPBCC domain-containing protein [Roseibium album]|uniref:SRPBCC domain-containing protein n=1 Tax=Roseibium album TaxID=311410 RepID=UPI00391B78CB
MTLSFKIAGRIDRPVSEVFEAVVNPDTLSNYFTTAGSSGPLETGKAVQWNFEDFPGPVNVRVSEVVRDQKIVLHWAARDADENDDRETTISMVFEPLENGRTLVSISEEGWRDTPRGRDTSYENCEGWTQLLCSLKAFIEHGVDLRRDYYK